MNALVHGVPRHRVSPHRVLRRAPRVRTSGPELVTGPPRTPRSHRAPRPRPVVVPHPCRAAGVLVASLGGTVAVMTGVYLVAARVAQGGS